LADPTFEHQDLIFWILQHSNAWRRTDFSFADLHLEKSKSKVRDGGQRPDYSYVTDETESVQSEVTQGLVMSTP